MGVTCEPRTPRSLSLPRRTGLLIIGVAADARVAVECRVTADGYGDAVGFGSSGRLAIRARRAGRAGRLFAGRGLLPGRVLSDCAGGDDGGGATE